eukprot:1475948-Amphidinium_carterae.1
MRPLVLTHHMRSTGKPELKSPPTKQGKGRTWDLSLAYQHKISKERADDAIPVIGLDYGYQHAKRVHPSVQGNYPSLLCQGDCSTSPGIGISEDDA